VGPSDAEEGETHQAFFSKEKERESGRQTGGTSVSQSGGQHACSQEKIRVEEVEREEIERKKIVRSAARKTLKDPHGGLTKAGREWFAKTQGSHLKPGVKKSRSEMTLADMRRKGSWAVRFYGRKGALPPLAKPNGEPTRYALTAAAWGEPVPKTVAAAKRIAAKGHQLLAAYEKASKKAGPKKSTKSKTRAKTKTKTKTKAKAA
jgi:hypothetical protein